MRRGVHRYISDELGSTECSTWNISSILHLVRPVDDSPAHHRRHHLPHQLPAVKRSVVRLGTRLRRFKRPALPGIEDGDVGVAAAGERTTPSKINHAGGTSGKEFDNPREGNSLIAMQLG